MAVKESERSRGCTWWDVKVYCLEVGKAHNGYLVVTMSPNVPERTGKAFTITVGWWPMGRHVDAGYLFGVSEQWPHVDYKTMPDLLMKMCFDMDWKLTQRDVSAQQRSFF